MFLRPRDTSKIHSFEYYLRLITALASDTLLLVEIQTLSIGWVESSNKSWIFGVREALEAKTWLGFLLKKIFSTYIIGGCWRAYGSRLGLSDWVHCDRNRKMATTIEFSLNLFVVSFRLRYYHYGACAFKMASRRPLNRPLNSSELRDRLKCLQPKHLQKRHFWLLFGWSHPTSKLRQLLMTRWAQNKCYTIYTFEKI